MTQTLLKDIDQKREQLEAARTKLETDIAVQALEQQLLNTFTLAQVAQSSYEVSSHQCNLLLKKPAAGQRK